MSYFVRGGVKLFAPAGSYSSSSPVVTHQTHTPRIPSKGYSPLSFIHSFVPSLSPDEWCSTTWNNCYVSSNLWHDSYCGSGRFVAWLVSWLAGRGGVVAGCEELNPLSPSILCYPICVPVLSHTESASANAATTNVLFSTSSSPTLMIVYNHGIPHNNTHHKRQGDETTTMDRHASLPVSSPLHSVGGIARWVEIPGQW